MNLTEPADVMRRTMHNLRFIEERCKDHGPYEVTQLINSFLGALAHPWERLRCDLDRLSLEAAAEMGWPRLAKEREEDVDPTRLGELLRLIRNAVAHGNLEFHPDTRGRIAAVRMWNDNRAGHRTWGTIVRVEDMRLLLACFVDVAEQLEAEARRGRERSA